MTDLIDEIEALLEAPAASQWQIRINEKIVSPEVCVIDSNGSKLGVQSTAAAIVTARARGLDLVEINPRAMPPVCKFLDWRAFCAKAEREATMRPPSWAERARELLPRVAARLRELERRR